VVEVEQVKGKSLDLVVLAAEEMLVVHLLAYLEQQILVLEEVVLVEDQQLQVDHSMEATAVQVSSLSPTHHNKYK
jgi:hypothetical protein